MVLKQKQYYGLIVHESRYPSTEQNHEPLNTVNPLYNEHNLAVDSCEFLEILRYLKCIVVNKYFKYREPQY
jgi:hypothetical protein